MAGLNVLSRVMDNVFAYRLWQATHAGRKLVPLRRHNDLDGAHRVLDVGCGPGTNTRLFRHADYVGIDVNESYIRYARRHYEGTFFVADACTFEYPENAYDFILLNSLLHHVDDAGVRSLFSRVRERLAREGHIHVLDLVMPDAPSVSRFLARSDRGSYARDLEKWRSLFLEFFDPVVFEPFPIGAFGVTLWNMVYFKGKSRA